MNPSSPQYPSNHLNGQAQATSNGSQLSSPEVLRNFSTSQGRACQNHRLNTLSAQGTPHDLANARVKRKRPTSSRVVKKDERKKVSRACDACKAKKLRCTGTQPCIRCSNQGLSCEYYTEHRRGRPPSPEPATSVQDFTQRNSGSQSTTQTPRAHNYQLFTPASVPTGDSRASTQQRQSSPSSQEPEETRFEGHYIGPTSGIAFLHRAQKRFKQDFVATLSGSVNENRFSQSSVFSFGDGYHLKFSASNIKFPPRQQAGHLLDRYFNFAMPTYRFLHRTTVDGWLDRLSDEYAGKVNDGNLLSDSKAAVVLLCLATVMLIGEGATDGEVDGIENSGIFFAAAEHRLSTEKGPIRLESVQARLALCLYLLSSSRINQAWYTFGTMSQMILALGLHRKQYSQSSGATSSLVEVELRKQVFWSAYTLDKYLSVILGRPSIFRDEDVDQRFPDELNDCDLATAGRDTKAKTSLSVSEGPVFHAKLAMIVRKISRDLYPTQKITKLEETNKAQQLTVELKTWKDSLPAFLEPDKVDPSMLIPIFERQSTVLRLAYLHALILANRPSLLDSFADLSRPQTLPPGKLEGNLKECIDAAIAVVDIVNGFIEQGRMRRSFWFTHYISFCAISTLYVYTIQRNQTAISTNLAETGIETPNDDLSLFEAAERCQRSIYGTTAPSSPFRRYTIILDELKKEVLDHLSRTSEAHLHAAKLMAGDEIGELTARPPFLIDSSGGTQTLTPGFQSVFPPDLRPHGPATTQVIQTLLPHSYSQENVPMDFRTAPIAPSQMYVDSTLDLGLSGSQGELIGWAEFDSCAISWADTLHWNL